MLIFITLLFCSDKTEHALKLHSSIKRLSPHHSFVSLVFSGQGVPSLCRAFPVSSASDTGDNENNDVGS